MKELIKKIFPPFLLDAYYLFLPLMGAFLYRFPSRKLTVIGVTGTNGKSTVVNLAAAILKEAGFKTASLSSIKFKIGDKEWPNDLKMTMPGRFKIQKFLRQALDAGCRYVVLEVTSEGIKQFRHKLIDFDKAVFTNLSPEHIERHGGFINYKKAKGELFASAENVHVVNLDDENAEYFWRFPAKKKYGYYIGDPSFHPSNREDADSKMVIAGNVRILTGGVAFFVDKTEFKLELSGEFNIYNALAAICVGLSEGVSLETCKKALGRIKEVPGRMEIVAKEPFSVIVDYAHTPAALQKAYEAAELKLEPQGKMICVLGACGGGRDKWKRPDLAKIAEAYCSNIILTNEDPYDENPASILEEMEKGLSSSARYKKILNREEAIGEALRIASPGDVVIITGKGSELHMCISGGKKVPWSDKKTVKEELKKIISIPKKYEVLDHKADLLMRASGKTKEELFSNMLCGLAENQKGEIMPEEVKREIKIKSPDLGALLVDFLNEAISLSQINKEIYLKPEFKVFTDNEIEGLLIGKKVKDFGEDIKAATYHQLDIRQKGPKLWEATLLFDI